jgi:hypothetical protein
MKEPGSSWHQPLVKNRKTMYCLTVKPGEWRLKKFAESSLYWAEKHLFEAAVFVEVLTMDATMSTFYQDSR